uniref:Reverse transcriptase domain-containing protein n=1 Tax=Tanacetum cinerariifolium TaxID=118510 RepID=A0A699ILK9_TANCI|nr:hypothetical protein [Tanacetum cinerariifolium]
MAKYKESLENYSNEIATSNSNQEKEGPPQDSDIRQLIREECSIEVGEEPKQIMEDTILELVKICRQKELYCMHDNVDDLIESALNSKLLSINSQRLNKKEQEVKNVVEQPAERGNRIEKSLQNFRVIRKSSISLKNTSQISPVHAVAPILSTKEPDDEDAFEDIEYIEASLSDPEIVSVEVGNAVYQEKEEVDLEDISQIQDVVLREKLLSINRLIANIESLNDNPTPDCVLNSFVSIPTFEESDNSLLDNFSPEFETFYDHLEETISVNTTTQADDSLLEYDSFCFEIEPDQERLINVVKNDIYDDLTNDPLLEEANLFLASDNSIPSGIKNFADDSEVDICFLEELLIDDSIPFPVNEESESDNPSFPRPPLEPPDAETNAGEEISVVMNDELECLDPRDELDDDDYSSFMFVIYSEVFYFLLSVESEDTIFDLGITI